MSARPMQCLVAAILLLLIAQSTAHADPSRIGSVSAETFNSAWADYKEAKQSASKKDLVIAARKVVDAGRDLFTDDDERLAEILLNYGIALNAVGRRDAAKAVLLESLQLNEAIHGSGSHKQLKVLASLADAHGERQKPFAQLKYYKKALAIAADNFGKDSREYANLALRAGKHIFQLSYSGKGEQYLLEAVDYFDNELGANAFQSGLARFYLAKIEFSERNFDRSIDFALNSLDGFDEETDQGIEYQLHARALLVKSYEYRGQRDAASEHCVAIGLLNARRPDSKIVPLFRLAPLYPSAMVAQGREGRVDVAFTVDSSGFVRDPVVINRDGNEVGFENAAMNAALRFRYAPKIENGQAVAVNDVKTRITFKRE